MYMRFVLVLIGVLILVVSLLCSPLLVYHPLYIHLTCAVNCYLSWIICAVNCYVCSLTCAVNCYSYSKTCAVNWYLYSIPCAINCYLYRYLSRSLIRE